MSLKDRAAGTAGRAGTPYAADDSAPPPVQGLEARLPVAEATVLDLLAHELRRDGQPIPLRPKEYQLLATLASNPGRAFSRRQLLDLAWDRDRDIDTRTVDVHVHWLRAKIEASPRHPTHLITVRGFGYRLDPWPDGSR
jgi:DNA-binding response OmpR family regulator